MDKGRILLVDFAWLLMRLCVRLVTQKIVVMNMQIFSMNWWRPLSRQLKLFFGLEIFTTSLYMSKIINSKAVKRQIKFWINNNEGAHRIFSWEAGWNKISNKLCLILPWLLKNLGRVWMNVFLSMNPNDWSSVYFILFKFKATYAMLKLYRLANIGSYIVVFLVDDNLTVLLTIDS